MQVFTPLLEQENFKENGTAMADYASMDEAMYSRLLNEYSKLQESFEEQGISSYESYIKGVLIGLGFSPEEFHMPIPHLSGGQKPGSLSKSPF